MSPFQHQHQVAVMGGAVAPTQAPPTNLTATAGDDDIDLSWTAAAGATSYKVKRATVSLGPYSTLVTQAGTTYSDTTAVNGVTYYYVVTAISGILESVNSNQASAAAAATVTYSYPNQLLYADFYRNGDSTSVIGSVLTGQALTVLDGTAGTIDGKLYFSAIGASTYGIVSWNSGQANVRVGLTMDTASVQHTFLVVRATNISNFLGADITSGGITLFNVIAGVRVDFGGPYAGAIAAGDRIELVANGTALACFQNGVSRATTTTALLQTGTIHGCGAGHTSVRIKHLTVDTNTTTTTDRIHVTSPVHYQAEQRVSDHANLTIAFAYTSAAGSDVEASINGGSSWTTIATVGAGSGTSSGTLSNVIVGQYCLIVRLKSQTAAVSYRWFVTVGIGILSCGQSNPFRFTNKQFFNNNGRNYRFCVYDNANTMWREGYDPTDGQAAHNSAFPRIAGKLVNDLLTPCFVVPTNVGQTGVTVAAGGQWYAPGNSAYDGCVAIHTASGVANGYEVVAWYQGENSAITAAMVRTNYQNALTGFLSQMKTSLGLSSLKLIPTIIAEITAGTQITASQDAVRMAQWNATNVNDNIGPPIPLTDVTLTDVNGVHLVSDAECETYATRWVQCLEGWLESKTAARGAQYTKAWKRTTTAVRVQFLMTGGATIGGTSTIGWSVVDGGVSQIPSAVAIVDSQTVELTVTAMAGPTTVSYASGNTGAGGNLAGSDGLPAEPFIGFPVSSVQSPSGIPGRAQTKAYWDGNHLYSDSGTTLCTDGQAIGQASDQIGASHLVQATAGNKPLAKYGVRAGRATDKLAHPDGVDDFMATAGTVTLGIGTGDFTIEICGRQPAAAVGPYNAVVSIGAFSPAVYTNSSNKWNFYIAGTDHQYGPFTVAEITTIIITRLAGTVYVYLDGALAGSFANATNVADARMSIFTDAVGSSSSPGSFDPALIGIAAVELTANDAMDDFAYMQQTYGVIPP